MDSEPECRYSLKNITIFNSSLPAIEIALHYQ